jgi:two-component system, NarL family, response regulator DesR
MLAEDQAMIRGALATLLGLEDDLEVVAEAGDGAQAVATAIAVRPDVALLDIEMPGKDGITAAAEIRAAVTTWRGWH